MIPWLCGLAKSLDQLKSFQLHYQSSYSHQNFQNDNLLWLAPANKVTWAFYHMVLQKHVTDWNHYISTTTVPMTTKLCRVVTYLKRFQTIKSFSTFITWSFKITWQTKNKSKYLLVCSFQCLINLSFKKLTLLMEFCLS